MTEAAKKVAVERLDIINRLWELASLSPDETGGSIAGQVRASDSLAEIMGMKVQRTADVTKQFENRSEEELEFYANNGCWAESVVSERSDTSPPPSICPPPSESKKIN